MTWLRGAVLGVGLTLAASLGACGRMSQAGCVGEQYGTVRNLSSSAFEVLLHLREQRSAPQVIGTVPAGAMLDFEIPRGGYLTVQYLHTGQLGGRYVPSDLQRITYSCR